MASSFITKAAATSAAALLLVGLTAAPSLAASGPAEATSTVASEGSAPADGPQARNGTEYVGGGVWTYGVDSGKVFSVYDNKKVKHRATACDGWNHCGVSNGGNWSNPGAVASASHDKTWTGNTAYWNVGK